MNKAGEVARDIKTAAENTAKSIGDATSEFAKDFVENASAEYSNLA